MGFSTNWQLAVFDPSDGMSHTFLPAIKRISSASDVARVYSVSAGPSGSTPQAYAQTAVGAVDNKYVIVSPGDVVYLASISSHQYSYCYGFHYTSLKFFEFYLDDLSSFRPILIEQDAIDMNLKYNNHNKLEPHLRRC